MCFRNYFCSLKNFISCADSISFLNCCKSGYECYDCNGIAIEILPRMDEFIGVEWEEIENYFKSVLAAKDRFKQKGFIGRV